MKLENYKDQQSQLPQKGRHIIAQRNEEKITVYQAFNPSIANYAVKHQRFGGTHYSFKRMSWIKPGFMWMMYRSGWAQKNNQERILAIQLKREGFDKILAQAVASSFQPQLYDHIDHWKEALQNSEVRLQWDPDHDPVGGKLERKAIQLGLRGTVLEEFNEAWITKIEDLTPFVESQRYQINAMGEKLMVPVERMIDYSHRMDIISKLGLTLSGSQI